MEAQETEKADLVIDVYQTSYRCSSWVEVGKEAALYRRRSILRGSAQIRLAGYGGPGLHFLVLLLCKAHILCPRYSLPPQ